MGFTLFSIDSDDLSVTIFMEESYQKPGVECSSRDNLGQNNLHSKTQDRTLKGKSHQKSYGGRKVNYKQQFIIHELLSQSSGQANYI